MLCGLGALMVLWTTTTKVTTNPTTIPSTTTMAFEPMILKKTTAAGTIPESVIHRLPKIELHAHLNGCVRESTLLELAKERNVELSQQHFCHNIHDSASSKKNNNNNNRSLSDCFVVFDEIRKCVNDLPSLRRLTREALEDFAQHRVAYVELRSTPKRLKRDYRAEDEEELCTKQDYIDTVLDEIQQFVQRNKKGMIPRLLISVDRSASVEEATENMNLAIHIYERQQEEEEGSHQFLVGADLGGNPTKAS